jgi:hypothetical protein
MQSVPWSILIGLDGEDWTLAISSSPLKTSNLDTEHHSFCTPVYSHDEEEDRVSGEGSRRGERSGNYERG